MQTEVAIIFSNGEPWIDRIAVIEYEGLRKDLK